MQPMDLLQCIEGRRTVRHFLRDVEVPKEVLQNIVNIAFRSPTAGNMQGIDILVITNKDAIAKIDKAAYSSLSDENKKAILEFKKQGIENVITYDATAIILLVKNERSLEHYAKLDAGIMTEAILLGATFYGYGSAPIGILALGDYSELGIPRGSVVMGVALGKTHPKYSPGTKYQLAKSKFIE